MRCVFALVVTLALPALAEVEGQTPLTGGSISKIELVGWSKDERSFALRNYALLDVENFDGPDPLSCPGYVDHDGKKFDGSLELLLHTEGKGLSRFPIQDGSGADGKPAEDGCTPPEVAKSRLERAKAEFAKRGIDGDARGSVLDVSAPFMVKIPGSEKSAALKFTAWSKTKFDEGVFRLKGTFALRQDERVVVRWKVKNDTSGAMGATNELAVGPAWRAPSGDRFVFLVREVFTSGRGNRTDPYLFGVFTWQGDQLVAR